MNYVKNEVNEGIKLNLFNKISRKSFGQASTLTAGTHLTSTKLNNL